MSIIAKSEGGSIPAIEPGVYLATCYAIIDLGIQYMKEFKNNTHKIMVMWELPEEKYTDQKDNTEKPRTISKEYTLSLNEKANLKKDLEAWRGKPFTQEELDGFDMSNILGKSCQIQINNNDKGYAKIAAIMALPKGTKPAKPFNQPFTFELSDAETVTKEIVRIPEWIQKKIRESETYKAIFPIDETIQTEENGIFIDENGLPF